ncbi:hypothetical protein P4O66_016273, partial [Electrophorus voltai]
MSGAHPTQDGLGTANPGRPLNRREEGRISASFRAVRSASTQTHKALGCSACYQHKCCKRVPGPNGDMGVHARPSSGHAPPPNGPPSSSHSRSVPEAVCFRGSGQTPPVLLVTPQKGRNSGFSPAHRRSHWLHQIALFTVLVGHSSLSSVPLHLR